MAETTTAFKFDKSALETKLATVHKDMIAYAGKPGMNCFLWLKKNLVPLEARLLKGETSKELSDAINALKAQEPKV